MKKIAIVLSIVFCSFSASAIKAADNATPSAFNREVVTLASNETLNRDYFTYGQTLIISGTVNGDVYAAGGQIIVDGTINGDLLALGGTITVNGKISQDVRTVGGNTLITGEVGRNLTLIGGNLQTTSTAKIGGSLAALGGSLILGGPIAKDAKVVVGELTLTPKAKVTGNLTYFSEDKLTLSPGATVSGVIIHRPLSKEVPIERLNSNNFQEVIPQRLSQVAQRLTSTFFIIGFLNSLILGYLLVHFLPNYCYQSILSIEENPWKTLGIGIITLVIAPALMALLLALLIGISTAAVIGVWFGIALYLSRIIFAYWLGARFIQGMQRMAGPSVTLVVGLSLFYLLSAVTYIGPVITLLSTIFGLGAIVRNFRIN